jgi:putative flippase GtrA
LIQHAANKSIIPRLISGRFIKFCAVGATGTIIDFSLLNWLVLAFSVPLYYAATISFIAAVVNNFLLNKYWTFKDYAREKKKGWQFFQFAIVSIIGLLINLAIMYGLVEYAHVWYNLAKAAAVLVVLVWNYFANKAWTFQKNKNLPKTPI